jgi:hypothetical protein
MRTSEPSPTTPHHLPSSGELILPGDSARKIPVRSGAAAAALSIVLLVASAVRDGPLASGLAATGIAVLVGSVAWVGIGGIRFARHEARWRCESARFQADVRRRHQVERAELLASPMARAIGDGVIDVVRAGPGLSPALHLGMAASSSRLRVRGGRLTCRQRALKEQAESCAGSAVVTRPGARLGIAGDLAVAHAVARGYALQLARSRASSEVVIHVSASVGELPAGCESVVEVLSPRRARVVRSADPSCRPTELSVVLVSEAEWRRALRLLGPAALDGSLGRAAVSSLPEETVLRRPVRSPERLSSTRRSFRPPSS